MVTLKKALGAAASPMPMPKLLRLIASAAVVIGLLGVPQAASAATPHVFLLLMENHGASQVLQDAYVRSIAQEYGAATDYSGVTNPSLPNYLALTSGQWATDNFADQYPGEQGDYPDNAPWSVPNLFGQLQTAGITWGAYAAGYNLPSGWNYDTLEGNGYGFAGHHFPALYYSDVTGSAAMMAHLQPWTALQALLAGPASGVPTFSWITPTVQQADNVEGLQSYVNAITASAAWKAGGVLIVTWDNAPTVYGTLPGFTQAPATDSGGGNVLTLVISPNVGGGTDYTQPLSHYSTLSAIETAFGLPLLGYAATAPAWPQLVALIRGQVPAALQSETFSAIGADPTVTADGITLSTAGTGQVALAFFAGGHFLPVVAEGAFTSMTLTASGVSGTFSDGGTAEGTFDATTGVATWTLTPTSPLWAAFGLGG